MIVIRAIEFYNLNDERAYEIELKISSIKARKNIFLKVISIV